MELSYLIELALNAPEPVRKLIGGVVVVLILAMTVSAIFYFGSKSEE